MKLLQGIKIFILAIMLGLSSCVDDMNEALPNDAISDISIHEELAYPGISGEIVTVGKGQHQVSLEKINGEYIFEGDIKLTQEQVDNLSSRSENASVGTFVKLWTGGIIYYTIHTDLPNKQRAYDAVAHWAANTNVTFIEINPGNSSVTNYVEFIKSSGCWSYIGMIGGKQQIGLANGCSTGNTIHEIGHATGLKHEQSALDRDNHVIIHYENIESGKENNFDKASASSFKDYSSFDFGSIMMYGPYAFSSNGLPTITKLNGSLYQSQRTGLSSKDVSGSMLMYPAGGTGDCEDVTLTLVLDNYPEETSWAITDGTGGTVASAGLYTSSPDGATIIETNCLPTGCYTFTINDTFGDGICCNYGNGSFVLKDASGTTLASGDSFISSDATNFCVGGATAAAQSNAAAFDDGLGSSSHKGVPTGARSLKVSDKALK